MEEENRDINSIQDGFIRRKKVVNYRKKTITVNIFETTIKCNKLENFDKINNFWNWKEF